MAIFDGQFEVTVNVGGVPLPEYDDPDVAALPDDKPSQARSCRIRDVNKRTLVSGGSVAIKKYIEARSGSDFTIELKFPKGFVFMRDAIVCHVYVDGHLYGWTSI